jgi:protein-L-isoaspartate O-methyltransferase
MQLQNVKKQPCSERDGRLVCSITVMKYLFPILISFLFIIGNANAQDRYQYRDGDPDGIGKWYMGREIAYLMSHYGISWLERPEREKEERVSLLLKNMDLKPGMVVADIGAGSGYHAVRMSKMVEEGKVYAVDVEPKMIDYLDKRLKDEGYSNIKTILGKEQSVGLNPASTDIMLLVDVYHELSFPYEMARSMLGALKPGGKLFLVEYRAEDNSVPIKQVHKMTEKQAIKELKAAGFIFVHNITNLPWQHCLVFKKPE